MEPDGEGPQSARIEWSDLCITKVLLTSLLWGRGLIISGHSLGGTRGRRYHGYTFALG
jgi:hypothetical protein